MKISTKLKLNTLDLHHLKLPEINLNIEQEQLPLKQGIQVLTKPKKTEQLNTEILF